MLNEGLVVNDSTALVKSEIVNQLRRLGRATTDELERAVFQALVGHNREDVDWSVEDNQAGYYTWIKSFDHLITELIEDGSILYEDKGRVAPTEAEPRDEYSFLVYPSHEGAHAGNT
jgi:hypothetical protein